MSEELDREQELLKAFENGERIVFQTSAGDWVDLGDSGLDFDWYTPWRYKIAEKDSIVHGTFTPKEMISTSGIPLSDIDRLELRLVKSGIDGKLSIEFSVKD